MIVKVILSFLICSILFGNAITQTICPKNCLTCNNLNITICTSCTTEYYVDSTAKCLPCNQGCLTCQAPTGGLLVPKCLKCLLDYNLNTTQNLCFTCDSNCQTCSGTPNNCLSCYQGAVLNGSGYCYRDPNCLNSLCKTCRSGSQQLCQSCKFRYFLRNNGACQMCPYPCTDCSYNVDSALVISQFNLGTQGIKAILDNYNLFIFQMTDTMNRYRKYQQVRSKNPTVTFDIFLSDVDFDLLPYALQLNFSAPDFYGQLGLLQTYFQFLVDDTFILGISNILNSKIQTYQSKFNEYLLNLNNPINQTQTDITNQTNLNNYLYFNFTGQDFTNYTNWQQIFGGYQIYFGAGGNQKLNMSLFYEILYNKASFKRYFNGTLQNLQNTTTQSLYFNFQQAPPNCLGCVQGFYFSAMQNMCNICETNCLNCDANNCFKCEQSFYVTNNTKCQRCQYPCSNCYTSPTTCTQCAYPFKLNGNSCIKCITPCSQCQLNNPAVCLSCLAPFSLIPYGNGTCFRCSQDICKICSITNAQICIECYDGFSLVDLRCQTCPSKCLQCSSISSCTKCQQRYALNITSKLCQPCGSLCLRCKSQNPNTCLACQTKAYLALDSTCKLCLSACSTCQNNLTCLSYKDGLMLFGNDIISCRPGCKKCDSQNPQKCTTCDDRFTLVGINCIKCAPGCLTCDIIEPLVCLSCPSNRFLSVGLCVQCPISCTSCTTESACTACKRGFVLNGGICSLCGSNCVSCENQICKQCNFGYVLAKNGQCVQCVSSCGASCDASNPLLCTGCTIGFQMKSANCVRCPVYCKKCSSGICSQCNIGYQLNSALTCVKSCIYPCKKCTDSTCLQCSANFTLTGGKCMPDVTCGGKGCLFCPLGSYKNDMSQCTACVSTCASCTSTQCLVCRQGYYLNIGDSLCTPCPIGSSICVDSQTSILCSPGYILQALNLQASQDQSSQKSNSGICKTCQSPCKQCMLLPNLCLSCVSNEYRLNGTSCLKKQVVGSQIKFTMDYNLFLQSGQAQRILNTISQKVPNAKIVITYMRSGSTDLGIAAGTSQGSSVSTASLATSISSTIEGGFTGMTVQSSSIGVFYEDQVVTNNKIKQQQQMNIGIIIGVIVGVVVLCIIITIVIIKIRKRPVKIHVRPQSNTELIDLRLNKKKGTKIQYSTLTSFVNDSKILFA